MPVFAQSIPAVFIGLAGVMLLAAMAALWQSLRSAFGGGPGETLGGGDAEGERMALLAEKKTLLRAIKDIQFEREVGKISDEDFARLDRAYRRRAKEVLKLLDQDLGEFLSEAEKLVAGAMGDDATKTKRRKKAKSKGETKRRPKKKREPQLECPECGADNALDATFCKECGARVAPVECPSCGVHNDPDAKFCKACAKSLVEPEAKEEEE